MIKPKFFCNVCLFDLDRDAFDEYYEDERNVCNQCREEGDDDWEDGDEEWKDGDDFEEDEEE